MVRSLGFLGVRTPAFDEAVALYRDVLGLAPINRIIGRVGASA